MAFELPINQIIQLNEAGLSQYEIARIFGVDQSTINRAAKRSGITLKRNYASGEKSHNFKGYRTSCSQGYVKVGREQVREHRLIMAQILGRPPLPDEICHHKNGDKTDNRPENIQIVTRSEHKKLHPEIGLATRFKKGVHNGRV